MSKQTATREQHQADTATPGDAPPAQRQAVAVLAPARLPYHPVYEERYGISGMMWRALVEAVYPSANAVEGIILAVSYCQARNYDVMKKMVHIVPIWNSALGKEVEGVWEGVGALRATAFRTGDYAGCDATVFGPMKSMHFEGKTGKGQYEKRVEADVEFPEWAQITVYRIVQGVRCAFPGPKVNWLAAYGCQGKSDVPNDKWQEGGGSYMLEKCAEAAALRKAFPEALGGVNAAEEMEGRRMNMPSGPTVDHEPSGPTPPRPTREDARHEYEQARKAEADNKAQFRQTMAEDTRPTPPHDAETGEVEDQGDSDAAQEPEREAHGPHPGEQASSQTGGEGRPAPPTQQRNVDYEGIAGVVIAKIKQAATRKALDNIVGAVFAQDIETLRIESPEWNAKVQDEIEVRKKWFAR